MIKHFVLRYWQAAIAVLLISPIGILHAQDRHPSPEAMKEIQWQLDSSERLSPEKIQYRINKIRNL